MKTQTETPPRQSSDEADSKQLKLARQQGEAFGQAVGEMVQNKAHGKEKTAGDFLIGFAVEKAEGMHVLCDGGELTWQEPQDENAHIEIVVRDGADQRFIPCLNVTVTVLNEQNRPLGTNRQPFLWHPWLFHYGRNWKLPGDGIYTIRVHIDAPDFPRHDKTNGRRYAQPVDVEFSGVKVKTGQKIS